MSTEPATWWLQSMYECDFYPVFLCFWRCWLGNKKASNQETKQCYKCLYYYCYYYYIQTTHVVIVGGDTEASEAEARSQFRHEWLCERGQQSRETASFLQRYRLQRLHRVAQLSGKFDVRFTHRLINITYLLTYLLAYLLTYLRIRKL